MNVAGHRTTRTPSGLNPPSPANGLTGDAASGSGNNNAADVDMYLETPAFELSLDEFEEYALARLKLQIALLTAPQQQQQQCHCISLSSQLKQQHTQVLRKIEEMKTRNLPPDQFTSQLSASIKTNLNSTSKKVDIASHFILRAAYCRTEDLRRWFLAQECRLFRHRLDNCAKRSSDGLRDFLARNEFDLDRVQGREKERLRDKLLSVPGSPNPLEFNATEYYRVPFVQALELVSKRECFVEKGFAYVPLGRIVSIVAAKFRATLSKSLALAAGVFGQVANDESSRIGPLLKSMNSQYTGPGAPNAVMDASGENALTAATVDALAAQSMPLCMQQLHVGLKRDHKLKHQGRLQYGLFLKGAGMPMEEHMLFFQREFTKIMTSEQFNKNYAYNIRHTHGKEGKRA
eukprot:scaffold15794_cov283-Alexandrium_tamarense.AAC.2